MTHRDSSSGAVSDLAPDLAAEAESAQASAKLCQDCGLCCSGALFAYVDVKAEDKEGLMGTPVAVYRTKQKKRVFDLPCPALEGTRCSIYAHRPTACRTYLCNLTRGVLNGTVALKAASEQVASLKKRGAWLVANIPAGMEEREGAPTQARQVLAAWQQEGQGCDAPQATNISVLLSRLHGLFEDKIAASTLTEREAHYITAAFAYTKIADRHFGKTPLLRLYGELVQRL